VGRFLPVAAVIQLEIKVSRFVVNACFETVFFTTTTTTTTTATTKIAVIVAFCHVRHEEQGDRIGLILPIG
jgi:hypothetical protein